MPVKVRKLTPLRYSVVVGLDCVMHGDTGRANRERSALRFNTDMPAAAIPGHVQAHTVVGANVNAGCIRLVLRDDLAAFSGVCPGRIVKAIASQLSLTGGFDGFEPGEDVPSEDGDMQNCRQL